MFVESLIAAFLLGALVGAVLVAEPASRRSASDRRRLIKAQAFLQVAREAQEHQGTPYRPQTKAAAVWEAMQDTHIGSRRAPDLADVVPLAVRPLPAPSVPHNFVWTLPDTVRTGGRPV